MPTFKRRDGSSWVDPSHVRRWTGSAWSNVGFVRRWTGSVWEDVWPLLTVQLAGGTAFDTQSSPIDPYAQIQFTRQGAVNFSPGGFQHNWHTNPHSTVGDDFEIMAALLNGTAPTGPALNTWHPLSSTRTWWHQQFGVGSTICDLTVTIRQVSNHSNSDSAVYGITVFKPF